MLSETTSSNADGREERPLSPLTRLAHRLSHRIRDGCIALKNAIPVRYGLFKNTSAEAILNPLRGRRTASRSVSTS